MSAISFYIVSFFVVSAKIKGGIGDDKCVFLSDRN